MQKFGTDWPNPTFALNSLDANGTHAAVELAFQIGDVIKINKSYPGQHGTKRIAILRLTRGGERSERASVKGILECENAPFRLVAVCPQRARVCAGKLQSSFPGFGAAVAEKCAIKSGDSGESLRKFRLVFMKKQITDVNQAA